MRTRSTLPVALTAGPFGRSEDWPTRLSEGLVLLTMFAGFLVLVPCAIGQSFGEALRQVADLEAQRRLLIAAYSLVWLAGFLVLGGCAVCPLLVDPALPQFFTMPLANRQVFARQLRGVAHCAAVSVVPTIALHVGFLVGCGRADVRSLSIAVGLAFAQGLLNFAVPCLVALFALRQFLAVTLAAANAVCLASVWHGVCGKTTAQTLIAFDTFLTATGVHELLVLFPGSWVGHALCATWQGTGEAALWLGVAALGCVACAGALFWTARRVYTKERVLEWEREDDLAVRRAGRDERGIMWPLCATDSRADRLYTRLFDTRRRAVIACTFRHDYTGEIGRRLRWVAAAALGTWALVVAGPTILRQFGVPEPADPAAAGMVLIVGYGLGLMLWSPRPCAGSSTQVRTDECDALPVSPNEQLAVYAYACATAVGLTVLLFLPAAATTTRTPWWCATAAFIGLILPVGMRVVLRVLSSFARMLHPSRSPLGALQIIGYWAVGLLCCVGALWATCGVINVFARRDEYGLPILALMSLPLLTSALAYPVWRFVVGRRNYDVADAPR